MPPTGTVSSTLKRSAPALPLYLQPHQTKSKHTRKLDVNLLARTITCRDGALAAGSIQCLASQTFLWGFVLVCFPGKPEGLDDMGEGDLSINFVRSITVSSPSTIELDHKFCSGGKKEAQKKICQ